jgi:Zn-finger nucleic acid-binding protein
MDPYRVAGFRCPTCSRSSAAPLREFKNRLCCDECHGILIDDDDYIASCSDLCNADLHLAFAGETQTETPCPRCERAMTKCTVTLTPIKVGADALRCERDGLWFADGTLAGVFAQVGRRARAQKGKYYATSNRPTGLDGLPMPTGGAATAGLVIGQWRNRPRRRGQTASPINLYRDQRMACPRCRASELRFFGDRYACEKCSGTFVQDAALEAMIMDVSKDLYDLPAPVGEPGSRACPVCGKPMVVEELEHVPIDRCADHGIWFDPNELTIALEHASHQFDPHGLRAWMKKLFT